MAARARYYRQVVESIGKAWDGGLDGGPPALRFSPPVFALTWVEGGSIPYPAVSLSDAALEATIVEAAAAHGVASLRYFPGISDMSFLGEASGDLAAAAANTPVPAAAAAAAAAASGSDSTGAAAGTYSQMAVTVSFYTVEK